MIDFSPTKASPGATPLPSEDPVVLARELEGSSDYESESDYQTSEFQSSKKRRLDPVFVPSSAREETTRSPNPNLEEDNWWNNW